MRLRFLILCVFSLAIQTLTAQVEHSILDSGLVWRYYSVSGSDDPIPYSNDYRIDADDTIINGKKYFEYNQVGNEPFLLAEDTFLHQVWVYSVNSATEVKIIDFKANVGDTLDLSDIGFFSDYAVVMDATSSITLNNGEERKAIEVKVYNSNSYRTIFWVDGIGSTEGVEYFRVYNELSIRQFSCVFSESPSFENLYGNCALSVSELSDVSFQLSVWPNPAKDVLNIETDSPMERIAVYNQLGGIVSSYELVVGSKLEQLDVSIFESGLYFLVVKTAKGVETKKVIIEN